MTAQKTIRTRLVKLLYRILSRDHPRGWIEIDWEETSDETVRVFSEGLDRFNLPEIEILECPADQTLLGYCHGMMFDAIGALQESRRAEKPIRNGDTLDLRANETEEPALVVLHAVSEGLLRLHDFDGSPTLFPSAATATYILNAAEQMKPYQALCAAELASQVHSKDFDFKEIRPTEDEFHAELNRSNARAYYVISDALAALNKQDEAIEAMKEAVARAPYMAEKIKKDIAQNEKLDWVEEFLLSIDPWAMQSSFRSSS